jgi:phenylpropionate dioxygenase-like ring-hydroxylating dioxygenase large terminal subunit
MQTLFDNALDPSHVPWSHHGVLGDRDKAAGIDMKPLYDGGSNSVKGVAVQFFQTTEQAKAVSMVRGPSACCTASISNQGLQINVFLY